MAMATPPSPTHEQQQHQHQHQATTTTADDPGFVWDPHSNLYYHASTGFYHDPVAGWYYSTRDGLYYAFQDGTYVPLQSQSHSQPQMDKDDADADADADADEAPPLTPTLGSQEDCASDHDTRPSQWLNELLINEYLSGYPRQGDTTDDQVHLDDEGEIDDKQSEKTHGESILNKQENDTTPQNAGIEVMRSAEEESWMAQYGQVERSDADEDIIKAVDLWNWELVEETTHKEHDHKMSRLMGRLVGQSSSLHPSLPSSGCTLKTTAIRQVHLDLVLVASGKLYKLRTPSKRYLATLSEYDSSNPTKNWGFPLLSPYSLSLLSPTSASDPSTVDLYPISNQKKGGMDRRYRDRASERRRLHGANGIAPCQKNGDSETGSAFDDDPMIAQEEARLLSFGTESYASKIMQSMGWKQGEALGSSRKGILEPIEARGNTGTVGLGWK